MCEYCDPPAEVCRIQTNKIQIKSFLKSKNDKLFFVKQIPVQWLKDAQYPIQTDLDIAYGSPVEFESGSTEFPRVTEVDTDKFVVCYQDSGDGEAGKCSAGSVSGDTISMGSIGSEFGGDVNDAGASRGIDVCKLDTDKFAVVYQDVAAGGRDGFARVNTVSGTTIQSWGTKKEYETGDSEYNKCASLATDKFVACYNDETDSDTGKCVAMTAIGGTTVTAGAATAFDGGTTDYFPVSNDVAQLGTDKFVNCFAANDVLADDGFCVAGTVSTRSITFGLVAAIPNSDDDVQYFGVAGFDANKFVTSFTNNTDQSGDTVAASLSGTTITFGDIVVHQSSSYNQANSVEAIDSTNFVIAYNHFSNSNYGTSNYSEISGTTITLGSGEVFNAASTGNPAGVDISLISANKVIICYRDVSHGECIVGDTPAAAPPATGEETPIGIIRFD